MSIEVFFSVRVVLRAVKNISAADGRMFVRYPRFTGCTVVVFLLVPSPSSGHSALSDNRFFHLEEMELNSSE